MSAQEFVASLPQEILVIHDRADRLIPVSDAIALKEKRKDARLLITEGLGHFKILQSQTVLAETASFIGSSGMDQSGDLAERAIS